MKTSYSTAIALAVSTLIAGHALAADADVGKTREQVQAELVQARATGNVTAPDQLSIDYTGRTSAKMNEVFPARYPAVAGAPAKTRAEVRTELAEAQRTGDMPADNLLSLVVTGVPGNKLNALYPSQYPVKARTANTGQVVAAAY